MISYVKGNEFENFKEYIKFIHPGKKCFISSTGKEAFSKSIPIIVNNECPESYMAGYVGIYSEMLFVLEIARFIETDKDEILKALLPTEKEIELPKKLSKQMKERYDSIYKQVRKSFTDYANGKNIEYNSLIQSASIIHKLKERIWFMKYVSIDTCIEDLLSPCNPTVIKETTKLIEVFVEKFIHNGMIKKDSYVVYHPQFMPWGALCDGAIADIFIDGVLYDFKSRKEMGYKWAEVGQLYSYYIMNCLCAKSSQLSGDLFGDLSGQEIKSIALYYSRFGDIEKCNLAESNADFSDSDIAFVAKMILAKHVEAMKSIETSTKLILRRRIFEKNNTRTLQPLTPKDVNYSEGETVYDLIEGKGVVVGFYLQDNIWFVKIVFEKSGIKTGDINKIVLVSQKDAINEQRQAIHDFLSFPAYLPFSDGINCSITI